MKANIINLVKNPRYRLLHIDDNHYIMDMGSSFLRTIFPFFFWILPNTIYKVDDEKMIRQLKAPLKEKTEGPGPLVFGGIGVLLPNLTGSLVDYFDLSMPVWLTLSLLLISLISIIFLFQIFNQRYEKKLYSIIPFELLSRYKIRLHPKSFKHFLKLLGIYVLFLVVSVFSYIGYVKLQNVFLLFAASLFLFFLLISSHFPGEEGRTTVKFLYNKKS